MTQSSVLVKLPNVYRPGGQVAGMGAAEPAGQLFPGGHVLHPVLPVVPSYVPSRHVSHRGMRSFGAAVAKPQGLGTAAPATQNLPRGHALQLDCASSSWYVPASQSSHVSLEALTFEPARQRSGVVAPALHAWPAGHALQLDWPLSSWYVPASHFKGIALPCGQYAPCGHGSASAVAGSGQ